MFKDEMCQEFDTLREEIAALKQENAQLNKRLELDDADIHDFFAALQKRIHANGIEKGWWPKIGVVSGCPPALPLEIHALIHCEIAEASEEVRKGSHPIYTDSNFKPQGEAIELADAVIIIMSYFEANGWNLGLAIHSKHEHNKTRPYREGYRK